MTKTKIFISLLIGISIGMAFSACSQSDERLINTMGGRNNNGLYSYKLTLDCPIPGFEDGNATRAISNEWPDKATLFCRFKSGSTFIPGYIILDKLEKTWTLWTYNGLPNTTSSADCEIYYFIDNNGQYYVPNNETGCFDLYQNGSLMEHTNISFYSGTESSFLAGQLPLLSENFSIFSSTTATYTSSTDTWHVSLSAALKPRTWRLRFNGTNGTKISLPKSGNDIKYYTSFDLKGGTFTKEAKEVSLTVSSSYTPYIFGEFNYSYIENDLIVVNNTYSSYKFKRKFLASNLPLGGSGYFTIPTPTNYSTYGWATDATPISVTPTSLTFDATGGSKSLSITSSESWTASSNQSWCTLSKTSGSGNGTITVSASANTTSSNRTATITITGSISAAKTVSVTQQKPTIDTDCYLRSNVMATFTDGMVTDWIVGSTVSTAYHAVLNQSQYSGKSDEELVAILLNANKGDAQYYNDYINGSFGESFTANTQYYLCTVAFNSSGQRGEVTKTPFKTKATGLPYAEVSNIQRREAAKWTFDVTLKNNAKYYYLYTSTGLEDFNKNAHFVAFWLYYWAINGQLDKHDWTSVSYTPEAPNTYVTICTWGVASNGTIGDYKCYAFANASYAPANRRKANKEKIGNYSLSKKELYKMKNRMIRMKVEGK